MRLRRALVALLLLIFAVALVAPALAAEDCGCCGGSCDTACCLLRAKAGLSIGHPTSERPHWKASLEARSEAPCGATCGAGASLPLPDRAGAEVVHGRADGAVRWAVAEVLTGRLDPRSRPSAPRAPPLPS